MDHPVVYRPIQTSIQLVFTFIHKYFLEIPAGLSPTPVKFMVNFLAMHDQYLASTAWN